MGTKWTALVLPLAWMGCSDTEQVAPSEPERAATRPPTRAIAAARSADGPSGTISFADDSAWTATTSVLLQVEASEDTTEMCISTRGRCTAWEKLGQTKRVTLQRRRRQQTIYALFRDADGNVSDPATLSVYLDKAPPTGDEPDVTPGSGSVTVEWTAYRDTVSGLDNHFIVGHEGTRPPRCSRSDVLWEGDSTATDATITGLISGNYSVRLCVQDAAGNINPSRAYTVSVTGEEDPPVVVDFALNSGDVTTRSRDIYLNSDISDASGVSHYCVSEVYESADDCRPWIAYSTAAPYELSGGAEEKTVRAWFRDPHGNVSDTAEDTILFDWLPPRNGSVDAEVDEDSITVSWSGYTEDVTSIETYVVVRADEFAPDSCAEGTEVARDLVDEITVTNLDPGKHGFRVCAVDTAGNISDGKTVRKTVVPPEVPPVISAFTASGGAATVCDRDVELTLTAAGEGEITRMCLDEDATCSVWRAYDAAPSFRLSAGTGEKTIHAWVRDEFGVETSAATELDLTLIDCTADLALSSLEVDLGAICSTEDTEYTVSNDGTIDLTIDDISITNDGDAAWSSADLTGFPWVLAPGDSRTITLTGTPGDAELTIESDADGAPTVTVPLTATQDAAPEIDGSSLPDGESIAVGEAADFTVSISDPDTASTDLSVSWTSDVDGALGTTEGTADDASVYAWDGVGTTGGSHTITATVTDACGQTDSTTFTVCQDEGYSADELDLSTWNFEGDAVWDAGNGWVEITSPTYYQVGSAYQTASTVGSGNIDISASFYVSGGSGADGITVTALDADRMTTFLGGAGGGIGYSGLPGWTVEIDTWYNRGTDPTSADHVSVHIDGQIGSPETWSALPEMEDGAWHELRVRAEGTWFTVWVDDTIYIDEEISGLSEFPAYVGFSGATGGATNYHLVDSLVVTGSTCE